MLLTNDLVVQAPWDTTAAVLADLAVLGPCMPGAEILGFDGPVCHGRVVLKVGPVSVGLAGDLTVRENDPVAGRIVIHGAGGSTGSQQGTATALITLQLATHPEGTGVHIETELELGGRLAQFGAPVIRQVSGRVIAQFVRRLNERLSEPAAAPAVAVVPSAPVLPSPPAAPGGGAKTTTWHTLRPAAVVAASGFLLGWVAARVLGAAA
jgi:carbon monoxide dehydrogenase subunit G